MILKVVTVLGARPQFVKASALSSLIKSEGAVSEIIVHTGQHYDKNMSQVFFDELDIPSPHYNLEIGSGGHGEQTGAMLKKIEEVLLYEKPDWVLVYGDTNSTLAGALAAAKLSIPIAHVEAGLRSFNRRMPEEINRILTDHASTLLFAPSETAMKNLENEGLASKSILVGDVMYDVTINNHKKIDLLKVLSFHNLEKNNYFLCTIHRAENTDDPKKLLELIDTLNYLSETTPVIMPIHPRTKKKIFDLGINVKFNTCEPVGYLEMLALISGSKLVLTDSGGLQKEAFFCKKFCVTLRDETEWTELVDVGANYLVGAEKEKIISLLETIFNLDSNVVFQDDIYGDGNAVKNIIKFISNL